MCATEQPRGSACGVCVAVSLDATGRCTTARVTLAGLSAGAQRANAVRDYLFITDVVQGNVLALPTGNVGVEDACSGIRSLTGCLFAGSFLAAVFVLMAVLTVITKHLVFPGTVNPQNVGWWERAFAIVLVGWVGVAAFLLERRLIALASASAETASEPVSRPLDDATLVTDGSQLRDDHPITN